MKKFGFTLAELVLALSVVGIAAAITAPMFMDLMPNQEKVKVLKYYKTINEINSELLNNNSFYWTPYDRNCSGLECDQEPIECPYSGDEENYCEFCVGNMKYPLLFIKKMDSFVEKGNVEKDSLTVELRDSSTWTIEKAEKAGEYTISIDINGANKGPNTSWVDNKKNPDTFVYNILSSGSIVTTEDKLLQTYLRNPYDLKNKRKDYKTAASLK